MNKHTLDSYQPISGLFTDASKVSQPKGTYNYALNAIAETAEGDLGFLSTEKGNIDKITLPTGYVQTGHINLLDDNAVIFLASDTDSIIATVDKNYNLTTLVKSSCLGFDKCNYIKGVYRILNGCETVIYFVDGSIVDKAINLDSLQTYLPEGTTPTQANTGDSWDCSLFNLTPDYDVPTIELDVNHSGGLLDLGMYQVAVNYADADGNLSNTVAISNVIPIVNVGNSYDDTEGGDPTLTNKVSSSISIQLSNLDSNFDYVNIIIIKTVSSIKSAYKVAKLNISSTVTYTYGGEQASDVPVALEDITVDNVVYNTSKSIEVFDNRLFRANVSEKNIDWGKFQQAANDIYTYYKTSANEHGRLSSLNGYKNPRATFKKKSYLRDETYAAGIVWVMTDGTLSPSFHIPGREKNYYPRKIQDGVIGYTIDPNSQGGDPLRNVNHTRYPKTGFSGVDDINGWDRLLPSTSLIDRDKTFNPAAKERWEVYNTAIRMDVDLQTTGPNIHTGIMGYTESELTYPPTKDCDGIPIYPASYDADSNLGAINIKMHKIRHHRMPDTTLEPHFHTDSNNKQYIIQLGLKFTNIIPPADYADQVQGYYIVRAQRDNTNKTVIDKGIFYNNIELEYNEQDFYIQPLGLNKHVKGILTPTSNSADGNDLPAKEAFVDGDNETGTFTALHNNFSFHGAAVKFNTIDVHSDYMKIETILGGDIGHYGYQRHGWRGRSHEVVDYTDISNLNIDSIQGMLLQTNAKIVDQVALTAHVLNTSLDKPFINFAQQDSYAVQVDSTSLPFVNIDNSYGDTQLNIPHDGNATGLSFDVRSVCIYGSIKRLLVNQYGEVSGINYIKASTNIIPSTNLQAEDFNGDSFITKLSFKTTGTTVSRTQDKKDGLWVNVITMFVESDINTELRHAIETPTVLAVGETSETTYYPKQSLNVFASKADVNQFASGEWDEDSLATVISKYHENEYSKNFYRYNFDYSLENNLKYYFPISSTYSYCSDCLNIYPHRIIFSQKGFTEQSVDNFRVYLANDYGEIDGNSGEINDIWKFNDSFYIHAEEGLYKQQIKPYQLQTTSAESVYVGVGDALEIPPREMNNISTGFAGNQFKEALSVNEAGAFFPDNRSGKIFRMTEGLKEISNIGERNWFKRNLPITFLTQYKDLTGEDYKCVGTTSAESIGIASTYDTRHKRWILFKRDYKIIDLESFDKDNINFSDETIFENLSWTKSFDINSNSWKSYHSYLPNYMFNTQSKLYSSVVTHDNIWEHNVGQYQTFYNEKKPFIFEYTNNSNPQITKTFNSTHFMSNVYSEDTTNKQLIDIKNETFDNVMFYNDYQCSGKLDVIVKNNTDPYGSISFDSSEIQLDRNERDWSFNNLRDMTILITPDESLFTRDWNNLTYQSEYPIDKVVNSNKINFLKSQYETQKLRDKYLTTRLFYNNLNNNKMVINYIFNKSKSTSR